jgi:predicted SAM-dependent methyltransferase
MWTNPRRWMAEPLVDLYDHLRFEWKGLVGRAFSRRRLDPRGKQFLNLGSGADSHVLRPQLFNVDYYGAGPGLDASIDLRFPLPFDDATWAGVYSHHVLEHIEYHQACALLKEIHRVLRPGGLVRIVVPDGERVLRAYASADPREREQLRRLFEPFGDFFQTPMEAVNCQFRSGKFNRHHYAWDYETLALRLGDAGLRDIRPCACNASVEPTFRIDRPDWIGHSLYVEARKPLLPAA